MLKDSNAAAGEASSASEEDAEAAATLADMCAERSPSASAAPAGQRGTQRPSYPQARFWPGEPPQQPLAPLAHCWPGGLPTCGAGQRWGPGLPLPVPLDPALHQRQAALGPPRAHRSLRQRTSGAGWGVLPAHTPQLGMPGPALGEANTYTHTHQLTGAICHTLPSSPEPPPHTASLGPLTHTHTQPARATGHTQPNSQLPPAYTHKHAYCGKGTYKTQALQEPGFSPKDSALCTGQHSWSSLSRHASWKDNTPYLLAWLQCDQTVQAVGSCKCSAAHQDCSSGRGGARKAGQGWKKV